MILARTLKGKGVSFAEDKDGWHGKAFKKGEELDKALAELEAQYVKDAGPTRRRSRCPRRRASVPDLKPKAPGEMPPPAYKMGELVATREAYGTALAKLGALDARVVALDADVEELDLQRSLREAVPGALLPGLHRRAGDGRRGDGPRQPRRDRRSRRRSPAS